MAVRGINKVILVGRLGKDPEVRYIPNGGAVANLQVATSENGVAPYIPAAFCRDAGSAGHGATEAARPERSLQARVSRQGWKPARAETASLAPFTTARPTRGTPGKAISRRGTERRGRGKRRRTVTGTVTTEK